MTRKIRIGNLFIGGDEPVMVQSMAATKTTDREATLRQVEMLHAAGAGIVRVAVDNKADVEALAWIKEQTQAQLSVDLQENYLLAELVAPFVAKFRYNPGHLHHLKPSQTTEEKVKWLVDIARRHGNAIRIGVNCGSVAPEILARFPDKEEAIVQSAVEHCRYMDELGFTDFCVSIKDSDPDTVIRVNQRFAELRPDVPLHLGVTEAGLPPGGVVKSRQAFEPLLAKGIGATLRVSLTLPFDDKHEEIRIGRQIVDDVKAGRFWNQKFATDGYNIISCPSCSRVENEKFIVLAQSVKALTEELSRRKMTIAVMGCRVNGPGETDDADLGLWCGPRTVNLKKGPLELGAWSYDEILAQLRQEIEKFPES